MNPNVEGGRKRANDEDDEDEGHGHR